MAFKAGQILRSTGSGIWIDTYRHQKCLVLHSDENKIDLYWFHLGRKVQYGYGDMFLFELTTDKITPLLRLIFDL